MKKTADCEIFFGALSNRLRCQILGELRDGEKCVNDLVSKLKTKQSLISHNLGIMVRAGLVSQRREGTFRYYSMRKTNVLPALDVLARWSAASGRDAKSGRKQLPPLAAGDQSFFMFVLEKDGTVVSGEGHNMEAAGFPPGSVAGVSIFKIVRDLPEAAELLKRSLAGERVQARVAGRGHIFELNVLPRPGRNGRPDGAIGSLTGISDRLEMEWKLRESEERWRSLVAQAPNVIVAIDPTGRITYINRSLSDAPTDKVIGKNAAIFFTPRSREAARRMFNYVLRTGERKQMEVEIRALDGVVRKFIARCGPMLVQGRPNGMVVILYDLPDKPRGR